MWTCYIPPQSDETFYVDRQLFHTLRWNLTGTLHRNLSGAYTGDNMRTHFIGHTPQDTLHRTHSTGHTPQETLHRTHSIGHTPQDTLHRTHSTGHSPHDTLLQDTLHRTISSLDKLHRIQPTLDISIPGRSQLDTINPAPTPKATLLSASRYISAH